jgi:dihydroorotate dehydrogenase electron transfer subunit
MYQESARVLHAERPSADTALVVLEAPEIAGACLPGQFVMVRCGDLTLRRPLSIHAASGDRLALLFRVVGGGTAWLARVIAGTTIDLTGPHGNGYSLPEAGDRTLLIAGGIGIAPLWFLAARMVGQGIATLVHGARSAGELYEPSHAARALLPELSRVDAVERLVATDDGSVGTQGSALQVALPYLDRADRVYLCGPVGMCVAACDMASHDSDMTGELVVCSPAARERLMSAEVSLEVRMGCGVGACYGCSIATRSGRRKVCTDGPVFRFSDVVWQELRT